MFHTWWSSVTRSKLDQMDSGSSVDPSRAMERFSLSVSNLVISSSPPDWLLFLFTSSVTFSSTQRNTRGEDPDFILSGIIHIYASLGSFRSVKDVWGSRWRWGCSSVWRGKLRAPLQITASHNSDCQQTHEGSQETTAWLSEPELSQSSRFYWVLQESLFIPASWWKTGQLWRKRVFIWNAGFQVMKRNRSWEVKPSCCRKSSEIQILPDLYVALFAKLHKLP